MVCFSRDGPLLRAPCRRPCARRCRGLRRRGGVVARARDRRRHPPDRERRRTAAAAAAVRATQRRARRSSPPPAAAAATRSPTRALPAPSARTSTTRSPTPQLADERVTNGGGGCRRSRASSASEQIADVAAYVVEIAGELNLPTAFPRDVEAFACDLDRTLIATDARPAPADACRDRRRAGRRASTSSSPPAACSARCAVPLEAAGIDDPVVCYQGAVVADPSTGASCATSRSRSSSRARRSPPSRTRASTLNCYVDDELYVAEMTPEAERYATSSTSRIHAVGDLARLAGGAADEARRHRRPRRARRARGADEGPLRRPPLHLQVAAVLPRVREPEVTKALGLDFLAERLGFSRERDGRVRRRRERRRAARLGRLRRRRRERRRPRARDRRLRLPVGRGGGRRAGARGPT